MPQDNDTNDVDATRCRLAPSEADRPGGVIWCLGLSIYSSSVSGGRLGMLGSHNETAINEHKPS